MSFAVTVFKAIDVLFDGAQNKRKVCRDKEGSVTVTNDIIYDPARPEICKGDLYMPKGKPAGAVLEIHGGGFVAGDKKHRRGLSTWMAKNTGVAVFSVNYGVGPSSKFPDPVKDVANAFNFLYDLAEEKGFDKDKILVCGDSAGAYYCAQLGALQCSGGLCEKFGVSLKGNIAGAILDCGVYDLEKALGRKIAFNLTGDIVKDYLGIDLKDIKTYEKYDMLSPIDYVNENFPETFITYAEKDFFCGGQGEAMIEKFKEHGVPYREFHSTKFMQNHTFPLTWKGKAAEENNEIMLEFIKDVTSKRMSDS